MTAIDIYLLRLAKQATEAGSTVEEVDTLLASVALPEDLVASEEAVEGGDQVETLPATTGETVSDSALALLRQLATTLDRLEARDRRFDQLTQEIADLRRVIESQPLTPSPAPTVETPQPSPTFWSAYAPYVVAVAAVVLSILVIALVVALLR